MHIFDEYVDFLQNLQFLLNPPVYINVHFLTNPKFLLKYVVLSKINQPI